MPPTIVIFPKSSVVGVIDSILSQLTLECSHAVFDFSATEYIDASGLILLLAWLEKASQKGQQLRLNLPRHKNARDYLRAWKFPEAVRQQTGRNFQWFATRDSLAYFGENRTLSQQGYAAREVFNPLTQRLEETYSGHYFPIQVIDRDQHPFDDSLALAVCDTWSGPLIQRVLESHLDQAADYLTAHIIFEAMINAIRHPAAKHIATAAQFQRSTNVSYLTLIWWDDGKSIIDTLKSQLQKGVGIRSVSPDQPSTFEVVIRDAKSKPLYETHITADLDPTGDTEDEILLVSSVFPGITRDPSATPASFGSTSAKQSLHEVLPPGMGLHLLVNAAIDIYGGEVSIRTRNYFLNLKKAKGSNDCSYSAKVTRYDVQHEIPGNMLTVRIPLRHYAK